MAFMMHARINALYLEANMPMPTHVQPGRKVDGRPSRVESMAKGSTRWPKS
jgi:hypothetical protein